MIQAATPIWKLSLIISAILGGLLLVGGIILAYFGNTAQTSFTLFGNQFSSTSVGISLAFMGVVLVGYAIRRILASLDRITSTPTSSKNSRSKLAK
jgi:uncharacterized integral membrane protein